MAILTGITNAVRSTIAGRLNSAVSGAIKSAKRNIKQLNERVKKIMDKDKYDKNFKIGQRKAQEQIAESKALKKPYSNSSVNKYLSKEYKKDKPHG